MSISFSCSGARPALHSFPTRRSSDLSPNRASPTVQNSDKLHVRTEENGGAADRKSTRLNSSHEWISYAVFCLKKKNTNASATLLGGHSQRHQLWRSPRTQSAVPRGAG